MTILERLNQVNDIPVLSVTDPEFASYGRVVTGYDFSGLISYMEEKTQIPENGNIYYASVPEMEADPVIRSIQNGFYGEMKIQAGYCNGRNNTYNGFEMCIRDRSCTVGKAASSGQQPEDFNGKRCIV